jgi:hypothetical protein
MPRSENLQTFGANMQAGIEVAIQMSATSTGLYGDLT